MILVSKVIENKDTILICIFPSVASCSFTIHVRDIIPPRVYNCPNDFDVYLDDGQIEKQVYWDEPIFADNVKIAHVMASKLPGIL